jgi:hypothetical protein
MLSFVFYYWVQHAMWKDLYINNFGVEFKMFVFIFELDTFDRVANALLLMFL